MARRRPPSTRVPTPSGPPPVPHSRPTLDEEEAAAAAEVVRSGYLAEGPRTAELERRLAQYIGLRRACAANTGSSALHLALLALGVAEGDDVLAPSYVCTALLNAIHYTRANPVLVDVDGSLNMCPRDAKRKLTAKTKAIIVPHLLGNPAPVDELSRLGPPVIEDCAQAIGAELPARQGKSRRVGSAGALAIFSFYTTKMLAAGECGVVAGNSARLIDRVADLKDYDERRTYKVRYNYKCTDVAAALAVCQLRKLPGFLAKRRSLARGYAKALAGSCDVVPTRGDAGRAACFRFVMLVPGRAQAVIGRLAAQGVNARRPIYKPLHQYLKQTGFPGTDWAMDSAVSLPIYPSMSRDESQRAIRAAQAAVR